MTYFIYFTQTKICPRHILCVRYRFGHYQIFLPYIRIINAYDGC
jgi:hypothetical protein